MHVCGNPSSGWAAKNLQSNASFVFLVHNKSRHPRLAYRIAYTLHSSNLWKQHLHWLHPTIYLVNLYASKLHGGLNSFAIYELSIHKSMHIGETPACFIDGLNPPLITNKSARFESSTSATKKAIEVKLHQHLWYYLQHLTVRNFPLKTQYTISLRILRGAQHQLSVGPDAQ